MHGLAFRFFSKEKDDEFLNIAFCLYKKWRNWDLNNSIRSLMSRSCWIRFGWKLKNPFFWSTLNRNLKNPFFRSTINWNVQVPGLDNCLVMSISAPGTEYVTYCPLDPQLLVFVKRWSKVIQRLLQVNFGLKVCVRWYVLGCCWKSTRNCFKFSSQSWIDHSADWE